MRPTPLPTNDVTGALPGLEYLSSDEENSRVVIPFRFPGGKYYLISALRRFWSSVEHNDYREPFVGGGTVFFAKPKVHANWLNDIDQELINTYGVMADPKRRRILTEMLCKETATKERWQTMREFKPESKLERAYKFYYLNRTSFSGKMVSPAWGYRPKRSLPPDRWHEKIEPCGKKLEGVKITCGDFREVIVAPCSGRRTLLFVDPPYFNPPKRKHYVNGFELKDHLLLAELLRRTEHAFILTYEDDAEVRKLYNWANIYPVKFYYRVDNSSQNGPHMKLGQRRKGAELIITNFKVL